MGKKLFMEGREIFRARVKKLAGGKKFLGSEKFIEGGKKIFRGSKKMRGCAKKKLKVIIKNFGKYG